jgi:hypothetical protein
VGQDGGLDRRDGLIGGIAGKTRLLCDLPYGEFEFEEFDEAQPLSGGKVPPVDPSSGEIVEGVSA